MGDKSANLQKYELSEEEWTIAMQLCDMLKIFKDATLFFLCSTPSLATVIPAMDHIDETLTNNSLDTKFEPSIRATLAIAKKTLNQHYNATDQSEIYHIAMVLHPHHKLKYFECAAWKPSWVRMAAEIVKTVFEESYAVPEEEEDIPPPPFIEKCKVSSIQTSI
ncbi:hypothetical protein DFH29DRAFT_804425 [Suillus ampliporus]|nr:hypothetical protein DFH29DRAFT_804425 [Suillus ampliporus]